MTTRSANVKGIDFLAEPLGSDKGGVAIVTFDLLSTAYTGGSDTIQIGGGGYDGEVATTSTLATIMSNRRRDGKTVTLTGAGGTVAPGAQAAATNGPTIYAQAAAVSSGNIISITLQNAATSGSNVTTTTAAWDRALQIAVTYTAV